MGDITGRSITRRQVSLSRPACAPEALLGRSNIGQGKCRDTERICFTAVPAVCEVASCYEHVWGGRTCPGVLIVAGPPFFSEKCSFLAALTYLSFSHCAAPLTAPPTAPFIPPQLDAPATAHWRRWTGTHCTHGARGTRSKHGCRCAGRQHVFRRRVALPAARHTAAAAAPQVAP